MTFLSQMEWRYATKAFDPAKPVSQDKVQKVLDSIRLAPTSFGLQPFRVHVITDASIKEKIREHGWKQPQYTTASHVLLFTSLSDVNTRVNEYFTIASGGDAGIRESMKGYESMMKGFASGMTPELAHRWAARQVYIAIGFAMAACAELAVDSCPMEGFAPTEIDKLMGFDEGEKSVVMLCLGYRTADAQPRGKVRFSADKLFVYNK